MRCQPNPGQSRFSVTPANGNPPDAIVPLLRRIHDRRQHDTTVTAAVRAGSAEFLGDIVADPAYTSATPDRWHLPIKTMGGTPIGRLHRTNQEGVRYHKVGRGGRAGTVATIAGRPVCECVAETPLAGLRYPTFPYTVAELRRYQTALALLEKFEWAPNAATRANRSRPWLSPHGGRNATDGADGGCGICVTPTGPAIGEDGRDLERCCAVKSRLLPAEVTALDMGVIHGSPEWYGRWNPRNRVEGSYRVLKNLAVVNWGRSFHNYVGLARETIIATFAVIAYNAHMLRQWRARQQLTEPGDPFGPLPSAQPTATMPKPPEVEAELAGPRGLEFLAQPPPT